MAGNGGNDIASLRQQERTEKMGHSALGKLEFRGGEKPAVVDTSAMSDEAWQWINDFLAKHPHIAECLAEFHDHLGGEGGPRDGKPSDPWTPKDDGSIF